MSALDDLTASLAKFRTAKRVSGASASYKKDNPTEYAKVIAYLDGGARPTGVTTDMGMALLLEEDARRSLVVPPPPPSGTYKLSENFDTFYASRWEKNWHWDGDAYHTTNEAQAYRDANVAISNGVLSLTAKREATTDFQGRAVPYTSGMIQSGGKSWDSSTSTYVTPPQELFTYTYGLLEARMKMPRGAGLWTALWLCDALSVNTKCYREIDILEWLGREPNVAHFNYHWWDLNQHVGSSWTTPVSFGDDFHVYGLDWRAGKLVWYVDGVERWRYEGSGVPSTPHYIIANLTVGSAASWGGAPDASTVFPQSLLIDYIQISP
ncbi:MAG: glycoside hydrolase family 16 protein [Gemmatimonadaceae bacterium]|nr:glycoside hydrolase family 16 protein [Gemmatimonadaceae bacterium]